VSIKVKRKFFGEHVFILFAIISFPRSPSLFLMCRIA